MGKRTKKNEGTPADSLKLCDLVEKLGKKPGVKKPDFDEVLGEAAALINRLEARVARLESGLSQSDSAFSAQEDQGGDEC